MNQIDSDVIKSHRDQANDFQGSHVHGHFISFFQKPEKIERGTKREKMDLPAPSGFSEDDSETGPY
jgi:hypothetical protein